VPFSAANDFSTPETDENKQPGPNLAIHKEEHLPHSNQHEIEVQDSIHIPDATLSESDISENKESSQDMRLLDTQEISRENQSTDSKLTETIHIDNSIEQAQPEENLTSLVIDNQPGIQNTDSRQYTTISPTASVLPIDDSDTRRKRLDNVKRKVAEAVRPEVKIEPIPEDPAMAVESVLGLVSDLESQLSRSRELEKALRTELADAKAELTRTVNDGRTASGQLELAEAQLEEKRKVLEEMLFEMGALEEERDQAVRMIQMLTVKDKDRQKVFNDLENRYAEMQHSLDESKLEEERLTEELDQSIAENTRLHTLLVEITRERDILSHDVAQLTKERNELTEAKKALEKVHQALSQARARLRE
jgi:DNA repair exonuclease SbcCD ATPase subunit